MERRKWLQLLVSLGLPCIGLVLDLYLPDALGALCSVRGITQMPSLGSASDQRVK